MKGLVITCIGTEEDAQQELTALGIKQTEIVEGAVFFEASSKKELLKVTYLSSCADRVLLHLESFTFKDIDDLLNQLKDFSQFKEHISEQTTFRAKCLRRGDQKFSSGDVEVTIGKAVRQQFEEKPSVELTTPDVILYAYVFENTCHLGVDLCGFELNKREYKIFSTPVSLRSTVAASLLQYTDYQQTHSLLDPFVSDGTLLIEAALLSSKRSINYYRKNNFVCSKLSLFEGIDVEAEFTKLDESMSKDKLPIQGFDAAFRYVDICRKNAKIAGVEKLFKLSRVSTDWLDVKCQEKSIDRIITRIPEPSRKGPQKDMDKLQDEFFYQAEFILKEDGKLGIICRRPDLLEEKYEEKNFKVEKQKQIMMGEEQLHMLVLIKI